MSNYEDAGPFATLIWTPDDKNEVKRFIQAFEDSEFGQQMIAERVNPDLDAVLEYAEKRNPGSAITLDQFIDAARRLHARGLLAMQPEPEVQDTRERDPQTGRYLSAEQLAEKEYEEFENNFKTSVQDIKNRKNTDPGFREWHLRTMQQQLRSDDPMRAVNNVAAETEGRYDVQLIKFADEVRVMPMNEVRRRRSASSNPTEYQTFNSQLERCFSCGLL